MLNRYPHEYKLVLFYTYLLMYSYFLWPYSVLKFVYDIGGHLQKEHFTATSIFTWQNVIGALIDFGHVQQRHLLRLLLFAIPSLSSVSQEQRRLNTKWWKCKKSQNRENRENGIKRKFVKIELNWNSWKSKIVKKVKIVKIENRENRENWKIEIWIKPKIVKTRFQTQFGLA